VVRPEQDAWLVDLDGTLYRALWVKWAMALELGLRGWSAVTTLQRFREEHEALRHEQALGESLDPAHENPFAAQIARTAQALGITTQVVEERVEDWMLDRPQKWIRRFPRRALLDEIRAFRASGGRTALVSDYPAERKLAALGIRDWFEVVVASGEAESPRRLKPDPEGYLRAAELLGVRPERCLVIGDRDDADGAAARAANMLFRLVK
jgi:HAD superfamily hydrolase (TIGR01549 family)